MPPTLTNIVCHPQSLLSRETPSSLHYTPPSIKWIFCHLSFHITRFFFSSLTLLIASAFLFTHLFSALRSLSTIKTHVRPNSRQPYHTHALTPLCRRRVPLRLANLHLWLYRRNCHVLHLHRQHCPLRSCCSCWYVVVSSFSI